MRSPITPRRRSHRLVAVLLPAFLCLLVACETVPETGRRQMILLSVAEETRMSIDAFEQIKQQEKISTDPVARARVERIGWRIAEAVGRDLPNAEWEFVVFDAPDTVNAFALAGGKVGVYTGIINLVESDDELAVIMGHEVAHVSSRHSGERISQAMVAQLGQAAVAVGTSKDQRSAQYTAGYTIIAQLGLLAFGREQEREADHIGLRFAARAGYNPRAGATLWSKMAALGGSRPIGLLSSHPAPEERIRNLEVLAETLMPEYEAALARLAAKP